MTDLQYELSSEDQVVFLHLAKTAGTTFGSYLNNCFASHEISPFLHSNFLYNASSAALNPYKLIRGHFHFDLIRQKIPRRPVTLTILRDPVKRVISTYKFIRRTKENLKHLIGQAETEEILGLSMIEFLRKPTKSFRNQIPNGQIRFIAEKYVLTRTTEAEGYIAQLEQPADLTTATALLDQFAFFGLTERFQESLFLLAYTFGWPPQHNLVALNVNALENTPDLPPELLTELAQQNALDQQLYDHAQQVFSERISQMTEDLLQKYGSQTHASTRWPLPAETMLGLLEKHYESRYAARHTLSQRIRFTLDRATYRTDWHNTQLASPTGSYRWTGPGPTATIDLPVQVENDLLFILYGIDSAAPDILNSLTIYANDSLIDCRVIPSANTSEFFVVGRIPPTVNVTVRPFLRIEIKVSRTAVERESSPNASADLAKGLAVQWLDVRPATLNEALLLFLSDESIQPNASHPAFVQGVLEQLNLESDTVDLLAKLICQKMTMQPEAAQLRSKVLALEHRVTALQHVADVAAREIESVHNSKPWRLANSYWQWRDRILSFVVRPTGRTSDQ